MIRINTNGSVVDISRSNIDIDPLSTVAPTSDGFTSYAAYREATNRYCDMKEAATGKRETLDTNGTNRNS